MIGEAAYQNHLVQTLEKNFQHPHQSRALKRGFILNKYKSQGVKVVMLGRQNERNSGYVMLAHTSIFGLCFMSVCLMKSNCYSFIQGLVKGAELCLNPNFFGWL